MDIDFTTLGVQLVIFVTAYLIMNAYFFQPLLRIRKLRDKETLEKEKFAKQTREQAETMASDYNVAIQEARRKASQEIQQTVAQASNSAQDMLSEARDEGQKIFTGKKESLTSTQKQIRKELSKDVEALANEFVQAAS